MVDLYTIGHGNRAIDTLRDLLDAAGVEVLVDVRAWPSSRRNPQFDRDPLDEALRLAGIQYLWLGRELGGMRRVADGSPHLALSSSMRAYADHMTSAGFAKGVSQLRRLAAERRTAVMCAEVDPAHCHRSLIADYLVAAGDRVLHLTQHPASREHRLDARARATAAGLVYDRQSQHCLDL